MMSLSNLSEDRMAYLNVIIVISMGSPAAFAIFFLDLTIQMTKIPKLFAVI